MVCDRGVCEMDVERMGKAGANRRDAQGGERSRVVKGCLCMRKRGFACARLECSAVCTCMRPPSCTLQALLQHSTKSTAGLSGQN